MASVLHLAKATVVAAFSIVPLWVLFSFFEKGTYYFSSIEGLILGLYVLAFAVGIALIVIVVFGLPIHMLLSRTGRSGALHYAIPGFFLPVVLVLLLGQYDDGGLVFTILHFLSFCVSGLVASLVFWYLSAKANAI